MNKYKYGALEILLIVIISIVLVLVCVNDGNKSDASSIEFNNGECETITYKVVLNDRTYDYTVTEKSGNLFIPKSSKDFVSFIYNSNSNVELVEVIYVFKEISE